MNGTRALDRPRNERLIAGRQADAVVDESERLRAVAANVQIGQERVGAIDEGLLDDARIDGRASDIDRIELPPARPLGRLSWALAATFVVAAVTTPIYSLVGASRNLAALSPEAPVSSDMLSTKPRTSGRIRRDEPERAVTRAANQAVDLAAVGQSAVLYEEDPEDSRGKHFTGSVTWRTETISAAPGLAPEVAVKADIDIPEGRTTMTMTFRRNTDRALPASHVVEIKFNMPTDSPYGGVTNLSGLVMKQTEQTRGTPLAGQVAKVTPGYFLLALSAEESFRQRNLRLLRDMAWFDISFVYSNGSRAILAIDKGTAGERAFSAAFGAWSQ